MSLSEATLQLHVVEWLIVALLAPAFGSFATVLEARVPEGRSIIKPRSACPNCGHQLTWHENIPLLGFLLLRGRCAGCRSKISPKYPLIELTTAGLFLLAFVPGTDGGPATGPANLAMAAMAIITVPVVLIDIRLHRLPNALTYPTGLYLLLLMVANLFVGGTPSQSWNALLQGLVPAALLLLLGLLSKGGMGLGDVKLAALLGWAIGWIGTGATVTAFAMAFLMGGGYGVVVLATRRGNRKTAIPFGPFLLAGLWVSFLGGALLQASVAHLWGL